MAHDPFDFVERARIATEATVRSLRRLTRRFALHRTLFLGEDGAPTPVAAEWLHELGKTCFADRSTFHDDPREHARREGRREVYLEILSGMDLDGKKLAALTRQMRSDDDE